MEDSQRDFDDLLATAHDLADKSGELLLGYFRQSFNVENKAGDLGFDPVTQADREAEAVIRAHLKDVFPDHGVVGEEFDDAQARSPFSWIIDPIDGTRAFIMGYPDWGTLIGLTRDGAPLLGMMSQPFTGERFWAGEEQSFYRGPHGDASLRVRDCGSLSKALLSTTSPDFFAQGFEQDQFFAVKDKVPLCRYGGDCYAYCLLAAGHIDLIIEAGLKSFDIVPLIPIIERAGGVITDWQGEPVRNGGRVVAAGSKSVHEEALKILAS